MVINFLVILLNFEVWKYSVALIWVGHDLSASIDIVFIEELFENIPNWLHEVEIHGFIVVFEINPSSKSVYDVLPFLWIFHYDWSAFFIILLDSHIFDLFLVCDVEDFINLILYGKSVAIPSESSWNEMTGLGSVTANNVFDCTSSDVSIMRSTSCKWWSIIESVGREVFGFLELEFEGINFFPIL